MVAIVCDTDDIQGDGVYVGSKGTRCILGITGEEVMMGCLYV